MKESIDVIDPDIKKLNVIAISSLCEDGKHVIFWDFDIFPSLNGLRRVEETLSNIIKQFDISNAYIIKTRHGYNAISLDKFSFEEVFNIKDGTPYDDRKHNNFGYTQSHWRLRIGGDKKLVSIFNRLNFKNSRSNSHRIFINKFFNTNIDKDFTFDNFKNTCIVGYWSWKEECINNANK